MLSLLLSRLRGLRVAEITQGELQAELSSGAPPALIDIRSAEQFAATHLPGARHVPLDQLPVEAARLDPSMPAVVY